MADGVDGDHTLRLVELANDPVVADAVPPETELVVPQRFAEFSRIAGGGDTLIHIIENVRSDRAVELLQVPERGRAVFNS